MAGAVITVPGFGRPPSAIPVAMSRSARFQRVRSYEALRAMTGDAAVNEPVASGACCMVMLVAQLRRGHPKALNRGAAVRASGAGALLLRRSIDAGRLSRRDAPSVWHLIDGNAEHRRNYAASPLGIARRVGLDA